MTDIGSQLRAAREAKGLTLEQAFKGTRIKASYLEAIEANQLDTLPGPVQARGFVRSYANYLGLDGEHLAALLDAHKTAMPEVRPISVNTVSTQPQTVVPSGKLPAPSIAPSAKTSAIVADKPRSSLQTPSLALKPPKPTSSASPSGGIPTWVLIIGAAILFVAGVLLVLSAVMSTGQSPAPADTPNLPDSIGEAATTDRRTLAPIADGPVSITLAADEHVWARVTVDGQTAFSGMLEPQARQDWQATDEIIVETGNAAALQVMYQGQVSVLGKRGQIVARAWGLTGVMDVPLSSGANASPTNVAATNAAQ